MAKVYYPHDSIQRCLLSFLILGIVLVTSLSAYAATINEYSLPTGSSHPEGITAGPDGNLWFTEAGGNRIGQVVVLPHPVPTMTEWGLTIFMIFAGSGSLYFLRRQKKV